MIIHLRVEDQLPEFETVEVIVIKFLHRDPHPIPTDGQMVKIPKKDNGYTHNAVAEVIPSGKDSTEVILRLVK